jgi:holo-[acyl-carrier protein] synthase
MIAGIGIDLVRVKRMESWLKTPGLPERYFHPDELAEALSRKLMASASLAARFAAKEAFGKALGKGLAGIVLKDIIVRSGPGGRPEMKLSGTALAAMKSLGPCIIHLSLSHERDIAIAMVVLENEV